MVLPPPAPDDAPGPDPAAAWLGQLKPALGLSKGGLLVLVDHARPELLGELVRALLPESPDLEVHTEVHRVLDAPHGATLVLVPRATDADWLNLNRPVFAHRELKVILFCDTETSIALARQAVDFFDWISHRVECPSHPPRYAVAGIRCALASKGPGIVWTGGDLESSFASARPRSALHRVSTALPFAKLVAEVKEHRREWIAWTEIDGDLRLMHARWALAEAGRRTRTVLIEPAVKSPGWWPIHARVADVGASRAKLELAGARFPGRLASLADLEPEAIELLHALLSHGVNGAELEAELAKAEDPGASMALLAEQRGLLAPEAIARMEAPPPALRIGGDRGQAHRTLRRTEWNAIKRRIQTGEPLGEEDTLWWTAWMVTLPLIERPMGIASLRGAHAELEAVLRIGFAPSNAALAAKMIADAIGDPDAGTYWNQRLKDSPPPDGDNPLSLAMLRREQGKYAEAETLLKQELAAIETSSEPAIVPRWLIMQTLTQVLEAQERYADAEALARQAIAAATPDEALRTGLASTLASTLINQKKYSEAEDVLWHFVSEIESRASTHYILLGNALHSLGITLQAQGKLVQAETVLQRALTAHEKGYGPDSLAYSYSLGELAQVLHKRGNSSEAEGVMRRSISVQERTLGIHHPFYKICLRALALILTNLGKVEEAETLLRRALSLYETSVGSPDGWYATVLQNLALTLMRQGRAEEAEPLLRQAIQIQQGAMATSPRAPRESLILLSSILARDGRTDEALAHMQHALDLSIKAIGPDHPETARIQSLLARVQEMAGDSRAHETARAAVDSLTRSLGTEHPETLDTIARLQSLLSNRTPKGSDD